MTNGWILVSGLAVLAAGLVPGRQKDQSTKEPTYHQNIEPLFSQKCMPCHTEGGMGPFALNSYDTVKKNVRLIKIQTLAGSMPPTYYHTDFGHFTRAEPLTDAERLTIQYWIRNGAPEGPAIPIPPPAQKTHPFGVPVMLDSPITPKSVPEGAPYWQTVVMEIPSGMDRLQGIEIEASSPKVVRRFTAAIVPGKGAKPTGTVFRTAGSMDLVHGELIGVIGEPYQTWRLPIGVSRSIEPKSRLYVQCYIQPSGRAADTSFKVWMYEADRPGKQVRVISLDKSPFSIEPKVNPTYILTQKFDKPTTLYSVIPEARYYASQIQIDLINSDGRRSLLDTVRWDPAWPGNFMFQPPIQIPAGSRIEGAINYVNDEFCQMNENKLLTAIKSGPGVDNEVCRLHLCVSD